MLILEFKDFALGGEVDAWPQGCGLCNGRKAPAAKPRKCAQKLRLNHEAFRLDFTIYYLRTYAISLHHSMATGAVMLVARVTLRASVVAAAP